MLEHIRKLIGQGQLGEAYNVMEAIQLQNLGAQAADRISIYERIRDSEDLQGTEYSLVYESNKLNLINDVLERSYTWIDICVGNKNTRRSLDIQRHLRFAQSKLCKPAISFNDLRDSIKLLILEVLQFETQYMEKILDYRATDPTFDNEYYNLGLYEYRRFDFKGRFHLYQASRFNKELKKPLSGI